MLKKNKPLMPLVGVCVFILIVVGIVTSSYKQSVLYEAKKYNLWSLFYIVAGGVDDKIEQNAELLAGWKFALAQDKVDEKSFAEYIENQKEIWGFDTFYFITTESYCTSEGIKGEFTNEKVDIYGASYSGKYTITSEISPISGEYEDLYIVPITGTFKGFDHKAIGVSYSKSVMKNILNDGEYSQSCDLYVINPDTGKIVFHSLDEAIDFNNVYEYMEDAVFCESNYETFKTAMVNNESKVEVVSIDSTEYYVVYLPIGYDNLQLFVLADKDTTDVNMDSGQLESSVMQAIVFTVLIFFIIFLLIEQRRIEKKRNENEIKYREAGFDSLVAHTNNAIIMYDLNTGNIDFVTESAHWAFGIEPEKIKENFWAFRECIVKAEDYQFISEANDIEIGGYRNKDIVFRNYITGEEKIFDLGILRSNLPEMSGKCVLAFLDKTEEIKKEKEMHDLLEAAQTANATKSQFLVNMSHIFRTPMNALGGYVALLEKNIDNKFKVKEYVDKLNLAYKDMLGLVNNLLEMSKNASGETMLDINEFNLSEVIGEAISTIEYTAKSRNVIIEAKKHNLSADMYMGDSGKLVEILKCFLVNAVQYNRNGGHVWINAVGEGGAVDGFQEIRINIADDGFGMDKDTVEHLFEPFSVDITNSPEKMKHRGMSLMIAKSIIDVMGGTVTAESTVDVGTTFTIRFKLKCVDNNGENSSDSIWVSEKAEDKQSDNIDQEQAKAPEKEERTDIRDLRILVVEDNEVNAEILIDMLEFEGAKCEHAADGVIADEMFEKAEPGYYDVILMDLMMPNRDGYEAAKVIRGMDKEDAKKIPILAVSANSYPDDIEKCFRVGMNGHVSKPIDLGKMVEEIIKVVNT